MKKALALVSGGKDSIYSTYLNYLRGWQISLLTFEPISEESFMLHIPNVNFVKLQAKAWNLKLYYFKVSGREEKEVDEMIEYISRILEKENYNYLITGANASDYQFKRIVKICEELGLKLKAPLWLRDPINTLEKIVKEDKIEFLLTRVPEYGLGRKWIGKRLTKENLDKFLEICNEYKIHPLGEGGEYETFVVYIPIWKKKIKIKKVKIVFDGTVYTYVIEKAKLVNVS